MLWAAQPLWLIGAISGRDRPIAGGGKQGAKPSDRESVLSRAHIDAAKLPRKLTVSEARMRGLGIVTDLYAAAGERPSLELHR